MKKVKKSIALFVVLCLIGNLGILNFGFLGIGQNNVAMAAGLNLIKNGDFESSQDPNITPTSWSETDTNHAFKLNKTDTYSGSNSVEGKGTSWEAFYQIVSGLSPNTEYSFTFYAKCNSGQAWGVIDTDTTSWARMKDGKIEATQYMSSDFTSSWTAYTLNVLTNSSGAGSTSVVVAFQLGDNSKTGGNDLLIDNISMRPRLMNVDSPVSVEGDGCLNLSWQLPDDTSNLTKFRIYNGSTLMTDVDKTATSATISGLKNTTPYTLTIKSVDNGDPNSKDPNFVQKESAGVTVTGTPYLSKNYVVGNVSFTDSQLRTITNFPVGQSVYASTSIQNRTNAPQTALLAGILYDSNYNIIKLKMRQQTINPGPSTIFRLGFDQATVAQSCYLDAFALDGFTNLRPISDISSFPSNHTSLVQNNNSGSINSSVMQTNINGNVVTITGIKHTPAYKRLTAIVLKPGKDLSQLVPDSTDSISNDVVYLFTKVDSDSTGKYSFSFNMKDNDTSGQYKVIIAEQDSGAINTSTYSFYSKSDRDKVTQAVNNYINHSNDPTSVQAVEDMFDNGVINGTGGFNDVFLSMGFKMDRYFELIKDPTDQNPRHVNPRYDLCSSLLNTASTYDEISLAQKFNNLIPLIGLNYANDSMDPNDKASLGGRISEYNDYLNLPIGNGSDYYSFDPNGQNQVKEIMYRIKKNSDFPDVNNVQYNWGLAVDIHKVNITNYTEMENCINSNNDKLQLDLSYYNTLSAMDKATVNKDIAGKDFLDLPSLQTAFQDGINKVRTEIANYNNTNSSHPSSVGSSGGGGGGSISVSTDTAPVIPAPTPIIAVQFNDLDGTPWAKESITYLASKNIINGFNNQFKPNDNITREQFIKILVNSFGKLDESATVDFPDVKNSEWYYPYIASAKKLGITNGKSDGTFGTGLCITREEMSVMAYRAALLSNIKFGSVSQPLAFTDQSKIADYAKDAVKIMQSSGIISGVGDNRFAPEETSTRAEAAKIVYEILILKGK